MTHKHDGATPLALPHSLPPSFPHSHLQHLLANLHLLVDRGVLEELHAKVALPQGRVALHAVAGAADEEHLHAVLASLNATVQGSKSGIFR